MFTTKVAKQKKDSDLHFQKFAPVVYFVVSHPEFSLSELRVPASHRRDAAVVAEYVQGRRI